MGSLLPPLACAAATNAVPAPSLPIASIRNSAVRSATSPKRPYRRVHFEDMGSCDSVVLSPSVVVSPPSPLNGLADWSGVWYAASDLVGFRDEARKHCRALRQSLLATAAAVCSVEDDDEYSSDSSSGSSDSSAVASEPLTLTCSDGDDSEESTRGLEARCCLERQRRKYLTNRCIVRAQTQLSGDQLALLAQRCTSWAATLAAQEGTRDYYRAYKNKSDDVAASTKRPAPTTSSVEECDAESRRVRPRTALVV